MLNVDIFEQFFLYAKKKQMKDFIKNLEKKLMSSTNLKLNIIHSKVLNFHPTLVGLNAQNYDTRPNCWHVRARTWTVYHR